MWATMESVRGDRLTVSLPAGINSRPVAGRFFLARTCDGGPSERPWTPYLRRVLRPLRIEARGGTSHWTLHPDRVSADDPGCAWLQARAPGDRIEILGPYGNGLDLPAHVRTLLLVADALRAPFLYPLIEPVLDRGGRVTLLLRASESGQNGLDGAGGDAAILKDLPLAVEVRLEPVETLAATVAEHARWADALVIALAADTVALPALAHSLRAVRFRLDPGYAHVLADVPLLCGVGACLACLVGLAGGGYTRACVHGPVFDLTRLG